MLRALRLIRKEPLGRAVPASGDGPIAVHEMVPEEIEGLLGRVPCVFPLGEGGVSALAGWMQAM